LNDASLLAVWSVEYEGPETRLVTSIEWSLS